MRAALGLVLLAFLAWLGYIAVSFVLGGLASLSPEVLGPLLITSGTVLSVGITVVGGQFLQRRAAHEAAQRPKKIQLYEQFMERWFGYLEFGTPKALRKGIRPDDPKVIGYLAQFAREVILWGSSKVVAKYSAFTKTARELPKDAPLAALLDFERLLLAMREDLGHSNRGLKAGDVLRLFVTDIDSALASNTPDRTRSKEGGPRPGISSE
ncbi:MAG: hypothetical protein Q8Q52_02295 [Acidimicrobiia bacterium]|nr:hypothetical protein [Acidimicrobiia bacterium]